MRAAQWRKDTGAPCILSDVILGKPYFSLGLISSQNEVGPDVGF